MRGLDLVAGLQRLVCSLEGLFLVVGHRQEFLGYQMRAYSFLVVVLEILPLFRGKKRVVSNEKDQRNGTAKEMI